MMAPDISYLTSVASMTAVRMADDSFCVKEAPSMRAVSIADDAWYLPLKLQ
jgi:hypothetical protein